MGLALVHFQKYWLLNDCYMTVSGHFFTICMVIFHKTEVETVVLNYLTYLNLNQLKSYGVKCILSLCPTLANSEKIATDKWWFYHYFWPVFCQLHVCLSQNWSSDGHFEVLDKSKYVSVAPKVWQKMQKHKKCICVFLCKIEKNGNIYVLCHNFWTNQNLDPLCPLKGLSEPKFSERRT